MPNYLPRSILAEIQNKIEFYLNVHRFDAAEKLIRATLLDHGPIANLYNLLGITYHRQSRFQDALVEFQKAVQVNPSYIEAALNLAATLCDLSKYDEAREVFKNVQTQLNPQKKIPNLFLGRLANQHAQNAKLYQECGLNKEAIREYRTALSLFNNMPDVRLALAKIYLNENQLELAKSELEALLSLSPDSVEARNLFGILFFKLGQFDLARDQWARAGSINPDDLTARAYLKISTNLNKNS